MTYTIYCRIEKPTAPGRRQKFSQEQGVFVGSAPSLRAATDMALQTIRRDFPGWEVISTRNEGTY